MSTPLPVASAVLQAGLRQRLIDVKQALALRHPLAACQDDIQRISAALANNLIGVPPASISRLLAILPEPAATLAGYRLLARLGVGHLGTTWLAQGNRGLVVAKRFHERAFADARAADAVSTLLQTLIGGGQRYLVPYLAILRHTDGALVVIQEYRPGRDAAQRVSAKGPIREIRALTTMRQVAKGLAMLQHDHRCHGNLHPGNILLDTDGRAALTDYALVGGAAAAQYPTWNAVALQRHAWAAPEELADQPTSTTAADVYALGCIGYWLMTGAPPFPGTPEIQRLQHLGAARPDVRQAAGHVSELTAKTLLKMMQQDPLRRYIDARLLVRSLERNLDALEPSGISVDPTSRPHVAAPVPATAGYDPKASLELLEPE